MIGEKDKQVVLMYLIAFLGTWHEIRFIAIVESVGLLIG